MYIISGADGKEYGPASIEQLRQWIAEGRVNRQTRVKDDGGGEWRTAADFPELGLGAVALTACAGAPPTILTSANIHSLTDFPVVAAILLHYVTCGIFSLIWLNLLHGKLPRVRDDDPSAGRAIGFCFIPFFNLYWIFFTYRRLCLRIDEQRGLYGLPPSNLTAMATTNCIFQVIPYINALIGITIITPIFLGQMQSSVNQLVKESATTAPQATLPAAKPAPGMPGWAIALLVCGCLMVPAILAGMLLPALARAKYKAQEISCVNNLKQIGLSVRTWAIDHDGNYPFNVSTNAGGALELAGPESDGFNGNAVAFFQVLSNELGTPRILICPGDSKGQPALDFTGLRLENVSYQVHSGTNLSESTPQAVLVVCPIHHNELLCDGSVLRKKSRR